MFQMCVVACSVSQKAPRRAAEKSTINKRNCNCDSGVATQPKQVVKRAENSRPAAGGPGLPVTAGGGDGVGGWGEGDEDNMSSLTQPSLVVLFEPHKQDGLGHR